MRGSLRNSCLSPSVECCFLRLVGEQDSEGWTWDRARADSVGRAYNYPHQTTSYWAMYHALKDNDKLHATRNADWYLDQAANTIIGMWDQARWYSQQGLMVGSVFKDVLADLVAESHPLASKVEQIMHSRTLTGVCSLPCACTVTP